MLFWRKKAIFSGKTKFQKIVRKIETNALTLKFSPHSEKLFAIAFTCVKTLFLAVGVESTHYCMDRDIFFVLFPIIAT